MFKFDARQNHILHLSWLAFFFSFVAWFNMAPFNTTLIKIFGKPFKIGIQNGQSVWVYEDHHYSIIHEGASKDLIIIFSPNGIVQSYQFMSSKPAS